MPSSNGTVRFRLVSGLLAALVCGLAAGEARAVPIPTQITYSTTGPNSSEASPALKPYEFRGVTDGVATLGSDFKLGTLLVHRQEPGQYMPILGIRFPIELRVTSVGKEPVSDGGVSMRIDNYVNNAVRNDGTILGNMETLIYMEPSDVGRYDLIQVGPLSLALKPVAIPPTWDMNSSQTVVEVDLFARLEGAPVPEPSVILVFAAAAGFGWKRLRGQPSRRS
jgi:hypothetical protein